MTVPDRDAPDAQRSAATTGTSNVEPLRGRERLRLVLDLTGELPPADVCCRTVVPEDKEALAELMLDAYRGTVDYDNETLDDAVREIESTLSGSYGRFLPGCSFVAAGEAGLASASLVTVRDEGTSGERPLLAFAMTRKLDQRRGIAAALVQRSVAALRELGYRQLSLVVTADNAPARSLYTRLGFRPGLWHDRGSPGH